MFVSMNWIKDFVNLDGLDLENLIHRFTLSTAEVEDVIYYGKNTYGVIVAQIVQIENHPNSKKLHLLKVDTGKGVIDVVCGAPNVREGMKVALATVGGSVNGNAIGEAVIAGYPSFGMCCSEYELGLSADHSGIMEVFEEVPLGTDIKTIYDIDDVIFEVDNKSLTNRPDLWGHYGIAREFSVLADRPLQPIPQLDLSAYDALPQVRVMIEDRENAYRYSSIKVENVTKKVSPVNMRIRLFYCGMRGINLLADLTNYIMLELGQPMHAFDAEVVDGIEVKRFAEPFEFQTLDENVRKIDDTMLMICSKGEPVAVAGVMGGLDSEIRDTTTKLLLESATFNGVSIRKTSTKLGLRTDASMRYEKMLDPELAKLAIARFLYLLKEIDPEIEVVSSFTDEYPTKYPTLTVDFDKAYVDRYTGIDISVETIEKTLVSLGFGVERSGDSFHVVVPSWRATKDVSIKADIIEEITRIYGYDNFEIRTTASPLRPVRKETSKTDEYYAKELLVERFHMHEVHTYIWCDARKYKQLGIPVEKNVRLINTLASDNETLRNSMIPSLLCVADNNKSYAPEFGVFEIGKIVNGLDTEGMCVEEKTLGIVTFSRVHSEEEQFFAMRNLLLTLSQDLKHEAFTFERMEQVAHQWQHPANTIAIKLQGEEVGFFGVLHPENQQKIDKKASIMFCQINMDKLAKYQATTLRYVQASKFPGIDIDLSLVVKEDTTFAQIKGACDGAEVKDLNGIDVIDVYHGEVTTMTIRLQFMSYERTLSMDEVQKEVAKVLEQLAKMDIALKEA